nr:DNA polymerase [Streptomyces sp. Tu6071]
MIDIEYTLKGEKIRIHAVEDTGDLIPFFRFTATNPVMGFDTETTGLDWWNWGNGFHCRLAQFGNRSEAYVLPVERGTKFASAARIALRDSERVITHNGASFDAHVAEVALGIPMEQLSPKIIDTKPTSHLVDPRAVKEGGPGAKLEELIKFYIDAGAAEEVKGSMTALAKKYKVKKEEIWSLVDLFDKDFLLYAGMDPVWAFRLFDILYHKIPSRSMQKGLFAWEHRTAYVTSLMERTGYAHDLEYAERECVNLTNQQREWESKAQTLGVENVNSNQQIIDRLTVLGYKLTKKTKKGNISVDDDVLTSIAHPLTEAIVNAKKAGKWRKTWFESAIKGRDKNGRVHCSINSCQARTARMTITGAIPAQTLPAGDPYVRHEFLADAAVLGENGEVLEEEHVSCSIDFSNMELRVMAAASGDPVMLDAFNRGIDLHNITAIAAFGPMPEGMTKHPKRKAGKGTNFAVGFGGGWKAVTDGFGVPEPDAKKAVEAFWGTYKGVKRFADQLQRQAIRTGHIYTATGRRIPVDKTRPYAALNYYIQSSARDITVRALLELHKAGYTPWMRLVIHDEIVFSFPKSRAEELAAKAAEIMTFTFKGLVIPAEVEIGARSWGSVLEAENSKH